MANRYSFILFLLIIFSKNTSAQNSGVKFTAGTIVGNIVDIQSEKPIPFATLHLLPKSDSAKKITQVADKNGSFDFEKVPYGYYRLTIQATGFANYILDSIYVREDKSDFNLNELKMKIVTSDLNEVVVYAEKPLIENRDGKLIYNAGESALNNGASAAEMLKNMPLMNTDPDGTLLLRGKPPLILMDEKPTNLSGQQLQDFLESLPANVVEKVEIMINPPPEYASYDGGVINIITKKGRIGLYSRFAVSGGTKGEASTSTNISYRTSKLNINANIGIGESKGIGTSYSRRENIYTDSVNYLFTDGSFHNYSWHPNIQLKSEYEFNKQNVISFVYQGNTNYYDNNSYTLYTNLDSLKNPCKASNRSNHYNGNGYNHGFSASYQWKGNNPVEKLQLQTGYNIGKNDNLRDFYQSFLLANFSPSGIDSTQNQFTNNYSTSYYARINYNKPLNDTGTNVFTTGAAFYQNDYHNILNTNFLNNINNTYVLNNLLSNDFYFHQGIFVLRAGVILTLPFSWKMIPNLQGEYTHTNFEFIKGNAPNVKNGYWSILPSITFRKEFNKSFNMAWVYRESIRRPGMGELNPSIDYSDPYNIRFGNAYLSPSLTDNYDFNINYVQSKFNINGSLGYNKMKNVFNVIRTLIDSGKTQTTYQNISDQNEYQASFASGITLSKQWRININAGYNYYQYSDKQKTLYKYQDGGSLYSSFSFTFSPDAFTIIEGNTRYSKYANPQGTSRSSVSMAFGVQRKFFNKKMVVALNAVDPFGLLKYSSFTYAPNFYIESHSESNTKNFRLTISYQLSKVRVKSNLSDKQKTDAIENTQNKKG